MIVDEVRYNARMEDADKFIPVMLGIAALPCSAGAETIGGDQGWYVIHCNVYDADVYFDEKFVGTILQGTLTVPAAVTGTPYKMFVVKKHEYAPYRDSLTQVPGKGETVDLYATLNPLPPTGTPVIGEDKGWYIVQCNIDGAIVKFDGVQKGTIEQGILYVVAVTSGIPCKTFTVEKEGYTTYSGTISRIPQKGEIVDLYATINPMPAATTATQVVIGGDIGWYIVHCNVDGATVSFDNDQKGQIIQGKLSIEVFITSTPYKSYTVFKTGYIPYTGTISRYPAKGETVDLYATLIPQPAEITPAKKSPLPVEIICWALIIGGAAALLKVRKTK